MLFDSSIRQELSRSFVATLVVLVTVVTSIMLIRMLGLASRGSVDPRDVIVLMGYSALGHLPTMLTLSLFIAVTNVLGRMYRESEMAVWFASGRGLLHFARPLLRFSWPIILLVAIFALGVWPWTNQQIAQMRNSYEQRGDLDRVSAGQFQENASGSRVFFVEGGDIESIVRNADGSKAKALESTARNLFVSSIENGKRIITSAREGKLEKIGGDQFLVMKNGQRMDQASASQETKITQFESYANLVKPNHLAEETPPAKSLMTLELIRKPSAVNLGELSWRLGLVLAALNLLLLALGLSAVNPRAGRGMGLGLALLAFIVYYNMLNVGFSRVATGKAVFSEWMLALHGGIFIFTVLWLWLKHRQWSWRNLLPVRTAVNTGA